MERVRPVTWTPAQRQHLAVKSVTLEEPRPNLERALLLDGRESLASFAQIFWPTLEPGDPLEWSWHHDLVCQELERVTTRFEEGLTTRLVICMPPGTLKSLLASAFWPTWWWLRKPSLRLLSLSSSDKLAVRDSERHRQIVGSELYQRMIRHSARMGLAPQWDLAIKGIERFTTTERGFRNCFSVGGGITGHRGDGMLVDDPHQVKDVFGSPEQVAGALERVHNKTEVALPTRVNDIRRYFEITIQQRVAEDDCAGRRLKDDDPDMRRLVLATHYDPDYEHNHPDDPRTEAGELLDPVRLPEAKVGRLIARLDAQWPGQGATQYEQRPTSPSGGLLERAWMGQRYDYDPQRPPVAFDEIAVTVDCNFKKGHKTDPVSIQAWGRRGWTEFVLLGELNDRLSYTELRQATRDFCHMYGPTLILVEEAANGYALISDLEAEFPGIVPFDPKLYGSKEARAAVVTVLWRAARVWLPTAEIAPWIVAYITELTSFPKGIHDDRVDAMSQLLIYWLELSRNVDHGAQASALDDIAEALEAEW